MDKSIVLEVMKLLQKKYGFIREISRLTEELGESVSRDDRVSSQLIINMRQKEMENAEQCDQVLYDLERQLPFEERLTFEELIKGLYVEKGDESFETRKIREICSEIQRMLKHTIEIDRTINRRISGDRSFYETKSKT